MDWDNKDGEQLLLIDADKVINIDKIVMSMTEVDLGKEGMARSVIVLAHKAGSAPDAVDYTLLLSNHAVFELFSSMSNNLWELIDMGWLPSEEENNGG